MKSNLKKVGGITSIIIGIVVLVSIVFITLGESRLKHKYTVPEETISIPKDAESLAEGRRIFRYRGCEACHGEHLEGLVYLDNPAIGQVITPNLTTGIGGVGVQRTDQDLVRSIRHGIREDGTALLFMPSTEFYYLSDRDLGRAIAYIRSAPRWIMKCHLVSYQ